MSLESELKRLNDNLEALIPALGGALAPATTETAAPVEEEPKPAKKKGAKRKTANKAKSDESDSGEAVDRSKVMTEIVEFIKSKLKGADDPKEMQAKVTEVRGKYGVELVGDLSDDKLLPFQKDITEALS